MAGGSELGRTLWKSMSNSKENITVAAPLLQGAFRGLQQPKGSGWEGYHWDINLTQAPDYKKLGMFSSKLFQLKVIESQLKRL